MGIKCENIRFKIDEICDGVPVVSTVTNLVDLFQKTVVIPLMNERTVSKSHYYQQLHNKSFARCVILLIPVLGNLLIGIYDFRMKKYNDLEFMLDAIKADVRNLDRASGQLKDNRAFMLAAIESLGSSAFLQASERLKNDRDFVRESVKKNAAVMEHLKEEFKNDVAVILEAMSQDIRYFQSASERLLNDESFTFTAVRLNGAAVLQYADAQYKSQPAFILKCIQQNGCSVLHYTDEFLKKSEEFMSAAIAVCSAAFTHASPELKDDRSFVLKIVKANGAMLEHVKEEFKADTEIALAAVRQGDYLRYVSKELQNDFAIVLAYFGKNGLTPQISGHVRLDNKETEKDFVSLTVRQEGSSAFQHASAELKRDAKFVLYLIRYDDCSILEYADNALKSNKEFMSAAIAVCSAAFTHADEELKNNRLFVLEMVKAKTSVFKYLKPDFLGDREIAMEAVRKKGLCLRHVPENLQDDEEIVMTAVKGNWSALDYASERLKGSRNIVVQAMQGSKTALLIATQQLQKELLDDESIFPKIKPKK